MEVGGEGEIIYLSLHCHQQNDFCIKVGSDKSHFNVVRTLVATQCRGPHCLNLAVVLVVVHGLLFINNNNNNKITDGFKTEEGVAAAALSTKRINKPLTCRLPDDSSIYTAELRDILLALKHVYYSKEKPCLILSDSLSSLQSIFNLKYDHPVLVQILELYAETTREGREVVFIWVPGYGGIRGNSAACSAAKDALDGDISVELIPFSDLK